ncbi:hypothetical protein [Propionivibrio sp.]|uniref:hypothetical protein n=1 Tax=Propionivibrio sp. TaxID=2212460 RepID=UPI00262A4BD2|nr:hypothetical protein [Propionivibrio sp.]
MLTYPITLLIVMSAVFATYMGEHLGFAIVHSGVLLLLTSLLAPGFYIAFFNLVPSDWVTWILSGMANAAYYYAVVLFVMKRRARR